MLKAKTFVDDAAFWAMHDPRTDFTVPDLFSLSRVATMGTDVEMNQARVIRIQGIFIVHDLQLLHRQQTS